MNYEICSSSVLHWKKFMILLKLQFVSLLFFCPFSCSSTDMRDSTRTLNRCWNVCLQKSSGGLCVQTGSTGSTEWMLHVRILFPKHPSKTKKLHICTEWKVRWKNCTLTLVRVLVRKSVYEFCKVFILAIHSHKMYFFCVSKYIRIIEVLHAIYKNFCMFSN